MKPSWDDFLEELPVTGRVTKPSSARWAGRRGADVANSESAGGFFGVGGLVTNSAELEPELVLVRATGVEVALTSATFSTLALVKEAVAVSQWPVSVSMTTQVILY